MSSPGPSSITTISLYDVREGQQLGLVGGASWEEEEAEKCLASWQQIQAVAEEGGGFLADLQTEDGDVVDTVEIGRAAAETLVGHDLGDQPGGIVTLPEQGDYDFLDKPIFVVTTPAEA